ncbi:MAG: hypothetical protein Kow00121_36730 [Elainellaceae cyanobacterium]
MQIDPELIKTLRLTAETALATAQTCLQVVERLQQAAEEDKYIDLDTAAKALGEGISADMLKDRCTDGRFKHGVHYINTSDGRRGNYLVKVAAVRKFFETDPSRRPLPKRTA